MSAEQEGGRACAFAGFSLAFDYYGMEPMDQAALADDYGSRYLGLTPGPAREATVLNNDGIEAGDYDNFLNDYFDSSYLDTSSPYALMSDIDQNTLVFGIINNSDGSGHQVVIVSCDVGGTVEYFDPITAEYTQTSYSNFGYLVEVTPHSD